MPLNAAMCQHFVVVAPPSGDLRPSLSQRLELVLDQHMANAVAVFPTYEDRAGELQPVICMRGLSVVPDPWRLAQQPDFVVCSSLTLLASNAL